MEKDLPRKLDRETLLQLPPEQLVDRIIEQAPATEKLNKRILELEQEVQKLKVSRDGRQSNIIEATIRRSPQKIRKETGG